MSLSESAQRRLTHYCRRAALEPAEYVYRSGAMPMSGGHRVRYLPRPFRELVWADTEICDALLAADDMAGFEALAETVRRHDRASVLDLLDLVSAMSLEREMREPQTA